jgi:hypothetical protein
MDSWNGLDFLIFLIFAANTVLGMQRGASREIISMMCLSAALIFTIKFTVPLALFFNRSPLIADVVGNQFMQNFMIAIGAGPLTAELLMEIMYCISMLICFVGVFSICEAGLTVAGVQESFSFPYATISRKVGAALGCTRGYIITLLLLSILSLHLLKYNPGIPGTGDWISGSFFARLFQSSTMMLDQMITSRKPEEYQKLFKDKSLYDSTQVIQQLKGSIENINPAAPTDLPAPAPAQQPKQTTQPTQAPAQLPVQY